MSTTKATIIRVRIDEGKAGLFYASSENLRGLLVAASTVDEVKERVPGAIKDLFLAKGIDVVVTEAEDGMEGVTPWVAVPAAIAAKSLAA